MAGSAVSRLAVCSLLPALFLHGDGEDMLAASLTSSNASFGHCRAGHKACDSQGGQ